MAGRKQSTLAWEPAAGGGPQPSLVYAAYLETLPTRPNHGDGTFPRAAVAALVRHSLEPGTTLPGALPTCSGLWWVDCAVCLGRRAAVARLAGRRREEAAWAALLLPVGALLGPRLEGAMGGAEIWRGAPSALRAAAFAGRLEGVAPGARGILARLGGADAVYDARQGRFGRAVLSLGAAAESLGLGSHVWEGAVRPAHPVALALSVRYRGRMDLVGGPRSAGT